jgi:hypothetical protein
MTKMRCPAAKGFLPFTLLGNVPHHRKTMARANAADVLFGIKGFENSLQIFFDAWSIIVYPQHNLGYRCFRL